MNSYFLHRAPSPTCYPTWGPLGPTREVPPTTFILHLKRYIYTLHNFTVLLKLDLEKEVWNLKSFGPWGPPPGPLWWPYIPYEHLWIPSPWGWFLPSLVNIQPCVSLRSRWTVSFYIGPPPQPVTHMGAIGATLGSATNILYSSP